MTTFLYIVVLDRRKRGGFGGEFEGIKNLNSLRATISLALDYLDSALKSDDLIIFRK